MKRIAIVAALAAAFLFAPAPAPAPEESETARLEKQAQRLENALVDADLEKSEAMSEAWHPYYEELWGNTPEARQKTQIAFDNTGIGAALRGAIHDAGSRVEAARHVLEERQAAASDPPSDDEALEIARARVVLLQTRLDGAQAIIDYQRALGTFVRSEVTGWADTYIKQPFFDFAHTIAGPFLEKMVSEIGSEIQSRIVDILVTGDASKWNPGIGGEQAAKGWSKLVKMTIKSGMDVEMRVLFGRRLNELAAANGYDPIPQDVTSYMFDYYVLAKAQDELEKDQDFQKKMLDKTLKSILKQVIKENAGSWAGSEAAKQAQQQYLEEFAAEWRRAMGEAHTSGPSSASPEQKEKLLAGARERVKRYMESRRGVYDGDIRKRMTDDLTKRFEQYVRDPKKLSDGLSILENADFAVNDIGVPLLTVWMNGAVFESIVENELLKYHIVDEFVKRKTNRRMNLALFKEWYPKYPEIAKYRDRWDLSVRADSIGVPADPEVPFLVGLHYTVRGVSALSEMKMEWRLDRPEGEPVVWNGRTTFSDEYDIEKGGTRPMVWEWLLTDEEVDEPGAYTVSVTIRPNYAPLGENPIAGPKLLGWTRSRTFMYGDDGAADSASVAGDEDPETAVPDSADVAQADSVAVDSTAAGADSTDAAAADSTEAEADSSDVASAEADSSAITDEELEDALDELEAELEDEFEIGDLLAEFESLRGELARSASDFDAAQRFFQQRLDEGRDAACGELGLAFAYRRAGELHSDHTVTLALLEEVAALLLAAADGGNTMVDAARIDAGMHEAYARANLMEGRLFVEMAGLLDLFGCDENDLERASDPIADPGADADEVDMGGYGGGGTEICGDGVDNDGDLEIDECDAGCCEGKNVQITVADCGNAADDVFLILVDGGEAGITPKGAAHTVSLNLSAGAHTVGVTTLDDGGEPGVADDVGTYSITAVVEGVETIGGAGCSNLDLGGTISLDITVPGDAAKAERSIPVSLLQPIGARARHEGR